MAVPVHGCPGFGDPSGHALGLCRMVAVIGMAGRSAGSACCISELLACRLLASSKGSFTGLEAADSEVCSQQHSCVYCR